MSDETNPKRQRGRSGKKGRTERPPSLMLFDVAHCSAADAAKANSRGRKPTERSGRGTQSRVAATAVTNCCRRYAAMNPSPQISAGWCPQLSAAVASRLNCAASKSAIESERKYDSQSFAFWSDHPRVGLVLAAILRRVKNGMPCRFCDFVVEPKTRR